MADVEISERQLEELVRQLTKSAGSLGQIANKFGAGASGKANARNTLRRDLGGDALKKESGSLLQSVKDYHSATKHAYGTVADFVGAHKMLLGEMGILGAVGASLIKYSTENVKVYQELSGYGQTFSGSMMEMTSAAAAAGLPIEKFAEIIKKHSAVVAQTGVKPFFDLANKVKAATQQAGMYGMSMQELADFQGDYLEIMRASGTNLKDISSPSLARNIKDYAENISAMTEITGQSREQTIKNANDALSDDNVLAQMRMNTANGMESYNTSLKMMVAEMGSQMGKAGTMLSKGIADTASTPGGAVMTQLGKEMVSAGVGQAVSILDQANNRIKNGEDATKVAMESTNDLKKILQDPETFAALQFQSRAGNQAATEILGLANQVKNYTAADIDRARHDAKVKTTFTAFMMDLEPIFESLKGALIEGFLKPFMTATGSFKDGSFFKSLDALKPTFEQFGESMGKIVVAFFNPANIKLMGDGIIGLIDLTGSIIKIITAIAGPLSYVAALLGGIVTAASGVIWVLSKIADGAGWVLSGFGLLGHTMTNFGKGVSTVMKGLLVFGAFLAGKFLINAFMNMFKQHVGFMMVKSNIVNVEGGIGGGGGLGGDLGGGGGLSKEEKLARGAGKAEGALATEAGMAAEAGKVGKLGRFARFAGKFGKFGKIGALLGGLTLMGGGAMAAESKMGGLSREAADAAADERALNGTLFKNLGQTARGSITQKVIGGAGKLAGSGLGKGVIGVGKVAGKFLGPAMIALGATMTAIAAYHSISDVVDQAKAGKISPKDAHRAIGRISGVAIGGTTGSIVGMMLGGALGSLLGPLGTLAGGAFGMWAGEKVGSWLGGGIGSRIGGMLPGSSVASAPGANPIDKSDYDAQGNIDPDKVIQLRTNYLSGDESAGNQLKAIKEALENHTAILGNLQKANNDIAKRHLKMAKDMLAAT